MNDTDARVRRGTLRQDDVATIPAVLKPLMLDPDTWYQISRSWWGRYDADARAFEVEERRPAPRFVRLQRQPRHWGRR